MLEKYFLHTMSNYTLCAIYPWIDNIYLMSKTNKDVKYNLTFSCLPNLILPFYGYNQCSDKVGARSVSLIYFGSNVSYCAQQTLPPPWPPIEKKVSQNMIQ